MRCALAVALAAAAVAGTGAAVRADTTGDASWTVVGSTGAPAYTNGWSALSGTSFPVQFRRDGLGYVQLEGLVTGGSAGNAAYTLPLGYRPDQDSYFACNAGGAFVQVRVEPTGAVDPNGGTSTWASLDCVRFLASGQTGQDVDTAATTTTTTTSTVTGAATTITTTSTATLVTASATQSVELVGFTGEAATANGVWWDAFLAAAGLVVALLATLVARGMVRR